MNRRVIIIFGFSGSGKSTLANLLARKYNLRVIHPSGILRSLCEHKKISISNTDYNRGFWESKEGVKLFKDRLKEKEPLDMVSDRILLKEVKKGNVVIDSWSLPWLAKTGLKIYLKADLSERAKRVSKRSGISYNIAKKIVKLKDEETRKLFRRIYGFDIKKTHSIFCLQKNCRAIFRASKIQRNFQCVRDEKFINSLTIKKDTNVFDLTIDANSINQKQVLKAVCNYLETIGFQ